MTHAIALPLRGSFQSIMRHNGSVAAEYVLILAFFAILALSNLDQLEDSIGGLEGGITASLEQVNTLIPGAASGAEDT
jgi:hypothetical protein